MMSFSCPAVSNVDSLGFLAGPLIKTATLHGFVPVELIQPSVFPENKTKKINSCEEEIKPKQGQRAVTLLIVQQFNW